MASADQHTKTTFLTAEQAEYVADNFAALGDPSRSRILFALTHGEQSVNVLARIAGISPSAVSHHLARLRSLRLVKSRRAANQVFYRVDDTHVASLFQEMLSHLDHIKRDLPDHITGSEADQLNESQEALARL